MAINISSAWSILIIVMNRWLVMHIWSMIIHTCMISHMFLAMKNLARVWNCPKFTILNLVFVFLSFCLLFKDKKEKRKTIPLCRFLFLCFCIFVLFLSFFVFVSLKLFCFCFFPWTPRRSNVWRASILKSHSLCRNSKAVKGCWSFMIKYIIMSPRMLSWPLSATT